MADPTGEYSFTNEWFLGNVYNRGNEVDVRAIWASLLSGFTVRTVLEIGSYEGRSACHIVESLGKIRPIELICIDTWAGSAEHADHDMRQVEARFDHNLALVQQKFPDHLVKFQKLKTTSVQGCAALLSRGCCSTFDFIHIDASHSAADVLTDAVLAYQLLRPGGLLIFDDYLWNYGLRSTGNPLMIPKPGIDAFVNCFALTVEVLHGLPSYQLYVRKLDTMAQS